MIRVCSLHFGKRPYFTESKRFGEAYCARHGYTWHILPGVSSTDDRDLRWSKIPGVKTILGLPDTSHVFYIDADAVVSNPAKSLDLLVNLLGDKDLLISEDTPNHINTGVWLARPTAIDLLSFWETTPALDPSLCHRWPVDEAGFIEHVYPRYRDRIVFKPRHELDLVSGFVYHEMSGTADQKLAKLRHLGR
ncbi:MAG TPA: hypothetical protein VF077_09715 [Nitrospiraceae bacterium]